MNENKLKEFVIASNDLPYHIKNNIVDMESTKSPTCKTPGCHAGLVSIVASDLHELKECYNKRCQRISNTYTIDHINYKYNYEYWADALAIFFGYDWAKPVEYDCLTTWANDNPEIWGNCYGGYMFNEGIAFGQSNNKFTHSVIIDHWSGVLDRLNKKGKIK